MAELPKIVLQRLPQQKAAAESHPDPNLISAFAENSLAGDARFQIMQHLAQCENCREVVFLSSHDQVELLPAPAAAPSRWLSWPVLRWGAAVAAVVVVAAAVGLHRPSGGNQAATSAAQRSDAPVVEERTSAPTSTARDSVAVTTSPILPQKSEPVVGSPANQLKPDLGVTGRQVNALTESASPAAAQQIPGKAKDAPTPGSNAGGAIGGGILPPDVAAASRPRSALIMPTVAPRWTLTSEGTLQRSLDFGRSWQTILVSSQASFRALAASANDIWVGGAAGALYHSTNAGRSWTQVQPVAAGLALTDDIIGVEFPDPLRGKLTTSSKETWITEDGGQTWGKQ